MFHTLRSVAWPPGTARRMLTVAAALLVIVAVGGLLVRIIPPQSGVAVFLASASPFWLLCSAPAVVLAGIARNLLVLALAIVVLGLAVLTQLHLYTTTTPPPDAVRLTVMTANLRLGEASPNDVVAAARRHGTDLLMLEELTPEEQAALAAAGLDRLLPYHASRPLEGGGGTGLWSRFPLRDVTYPTGFAFAMVRARVSVPGLAHEPAAVALHMAGPVPNPFAWDRDISQLPAVLDGIPAGTPVIAGGDFNATNDEVQFRRLLTGGYQDAADQAGAGYTRTYPSNRWFPPLLAIDHVLTRDAVATGVETVEIPGSDHRALVVHIAVAKSSAGQ